MFDINHIMQKFIVKMFKRKSKAETMYFSCLSSVKKFNKCWRVLKCLIIFFNLIQIHKPYHRICSLMHWTYLRAHCNKVHKAVTFFENIYMHSTRINHKRLFTYLSTFDLKSTINLSKWRTLFCISKTLS